MSLDLEWIETCDEYVSRLSESHQDAIDYYSLHNTQINAELRSNIHSDVSDLLSQCISTAPSLTKEINAWAVSDSIADNVVLGGGNRNDFTNLYVDINMAIAHAIRNRGVLLYFRINTGTSCILITVNNTPVIVLNQKVYVTLEYNYIGRYYLGNVSHNLHTIDVVA